MKKLIILISAIIIFFIFFLYMYFSPRSYKKEYTQDKVKIIESYDKEKQYYYFEFEYKNNIYELVTKDKYSTKRGLIKSIKINKENKAICLDPKSDYITTYQICSRNNKQISYNLTQNKIENDKILKEYKDIKINNLNEKTFLVWNYKGFSFINEDDQKQIKLLNKDIYNLDLIAKVNKYLIIPDYNNKHSFNKIYIIDLETGKYTDWEIKYDIYFNSYIVGTDNKSIFLFDKKNEIQYELRPDKKKIRKVKYKVKVNGKWESISLGELNKEIKFKEDKIYNYSIIDNKLYLKYYNGKNNILVSNQTIKSIIYQDDENVYYLVDDKLYMYNGISKETLLLEYFEWNFNYQNMIQIY